MRSYQGTHNQIAVSANVRESAINTVATLDTTMLFDLASVINLKPRRTPNDDEATGYEEADLIYDLGATTEWPLAASRAQPQHFALVLAYALGSVSTAALGDGYKHTITPIAGDLDNDCSNPIFTAAMRYGKTVLKRRFASMAISDFTASFSKDDWCKVSANVVGSGLVADNITEEVVSALPTVSELTLAANTVEGSSAAERLANIQRIRAELTTGVWTDVAYSAVSAAEPAVITISAPGAGEEAVNYRILYIPGETTWMTFPARVQETPLRVAQMTATLGGKWGGAAFTGGRATEAELKSIEWNFQNGITPEFVPGGGGAYASRMIREGRAQTLKVNREFREYILQQHIDANDEFGVHIQCLGALMDDTYYYTVDIVFPACAVIEAPISVDGKRLAEAGDLKVLEDATYGSVIAYVQNLQATYAA